MDPCAEAIKQLLSCPDCRTNILNYHRPRYTKTAPQPSRNDARKQQKKPGGGGEGPKTTPR